MLLHLHLHLQNFLVLLHLRLRLQNFLVLLHLPLRLLNFLVLLHLHLHLHNQIAVHRFHLLHHQDLPVLSYQVMVLNQLDLLHLLHRQSPLMLTLRQVMVLHQCHPLPPDQEGQMYRHHLLLLLEEAKLL